MDKKILFFPYSDKSFPLIEYVIKKNVDIIVSSFKGSGLVGKDVAYAINSLDIGVKVIDIHSIEWDKVSKVVLLDSADSFDPSINLYEYLKKEVPVIDLRISNESNFEIKKLSPILTPIIYVFGIFDSVFNSRITLNLKYEFEKLGIKVSILSADENLKYIDQTIYDDSFLKKPDRLHLSQYKVLSQIKKMEKDSEVIIVQVPGGFAQMNDRVFNDFGIYFSFLNNIVQPDYLVCSLPIDYYTLDTLKELELVAYTKFNKKIDSYVLNNGYWRFSEGVLIGSQPKETYLSYSELLKVEKNRNVYLNEYKYLVCEILKKLEGKNEKIN